MLEWERRRMWRAQDVVARLYLRSSGLRPVPGLVEPVEPPKSTVALVSGPVGLAVRGPWQPIGTARRSALILAVSRFIN
jgi:hypothetical protein